MRRNSRRPSEVDKLQRGLESVTKSVEDSKIRIYFQRKKKCKQKWPEYFQKAITTIWKKKWEIYTQISTIPYVGIEKKNLNFNSFNN